MFALCVFLFCAVATQPVHVINLPHRTARLARFKERFESLATPSKVSLELRVLAATDAVEAASLIANGTVSPLASYVDPQHARVMKLGEVGCSHSHFRAWQAIAADAEHDWSIVLEDDALFEDDFVERFADWRRLSPLPDMAFYAHKKVTGDAPVQLTHGLEEYVYSYWTVGYALTREAAQKLLDGNLLANMVPVDEYLPAMLLKSLCDMAGVCERTPLRAVSYSADIVRPANDEDDVSDTEHSALTEQRAEARFLLLTVATDTRHTGYQTLRRSAQHFGVALETLGADAEWRGGDMEHGPGGGHKLDFVKQFLRDQTDAERMVVFTDGYDTLLIESAKTLGDRLEQLVKPGTVVFAAERFCWPDKHVADRYPEPRSGTAYRYLNSGNYAGRVGDLRALLAAWPDDDDDADHLTDDQRFFTTAFLAGNSSIVLDYERQLFQTLNGINRDEFRMTDRHTTFEMVGSAAAAPCILHGNGQSKHLLQQVANYVPGAWSQFYGSTWQPRRWLDDSDESVLARQTVVLAVLCRDTPFVDQFWARVNQLLVDYDKTVLFLWEGERCRLETSHEERGRFSLTVRASMRDVSFAKIKALRLARESGASHVLFVDSSALISRPETLADLLRANASLVAGHAQQPGKSLYSNYWTSASSSGWFERGFNSDELYERKHRGLWKVPFIMQLYLAHESVYARLGAALEQCVGEPDDPDVCLARGLRAAGVEMTVDNRHAYAELLQSEERAHKGDSPTPDLFEAAANPAAWDRAYLNETFAAGNFSAAEICPDVYGVVVFNQRFCAELVAEMERYGEWSSGHNEDERISGGYENVPTQDIHTNQIGWEESWVAILRRHIYPLMYRYYAGSYLKEEINIAFVVRYITTGQHALRPHHDASTVTTVTTLSSEFEGGGARFTRYNCSHISHTLGMTALHPGKLTHQHEGLPITSGKRYILVSFNE